MSFYKVINKFLISSEIQTPNLARPFARRARMIDAPLRVFMRTKKPCVRLLLITEGWYVRFIFVFSKFFDQ